MYAAPPFRTICEAPAQFPDESKAPTQSPSEAGIPFIVACP